MDVLRPWRTGQLTSRGLCSLEQLEPLRNCWITRIKFAHSGVGVNSVEYLIVAAFVEAAEIEPDSRDVGMVQE